MTSNNWKSHQIANTFNAFFDQFEEIDEHAEVVLNVVFELLYYSQQKRISDSKDSNGR